MTGHGLHGRRVAGLMLAGVFALDAFMALLVTAAPSGMGGGPMVSDSQQLGWLIVGIGVALHVVGLRWMIRIVRTDPEAHASTWRSHRF